MVTPKLLDAEELLNVAIVVEAVVVLVDDVDVVRRGLGFGAAIASSCS